MDLIVLQIYAEKKDLTILWKLRYFMNIYGTLWYFISPFKDREKTPPTPVSLID